MPTNSGTLLFLDDRTDRIQSVEEVYKGYDITIVTNVKECLKYIAYGEWDVISLDHDLDGEVFLKPSDKNTGMEVLRYINETGWPPSKKIPVIWIHSTNLLAAHAMEVFLKDIDFFQYLKKPFNWKKYQHGVVAGAFDVLHPGYILLFEEAKALCHKVTVLLHDKPGQVFDVSLRQWMLQSIKYVDDVVVYKTEDELTMLLSEGDYDVRIVGSDHKGSTSRPDLNIPTHYHKRNHKWSATMYKKKIAAKVNNE